jgi:hypothetical protein
MPLDVTTLLIPVFGVLTALVVLPAAVFAVVAARRRGRRAAGRPPGIRVEVRPSPATREPPARSA